MAEVADREESLGQEAPAPVPVAGDRQGRWARLRRKVADEMALLWFSSRLTLGIQAAVLAVAAGGFFAFCALSQPISGEENLFRLLLTVETLCFVILSMGLLPREKEAKTLELLLVCSRSRHGLLLHKFLPVCLFMAMIAGGLTGGFYWLVGGFSWPKMLGVPYALAATAGILTVILTTYLRNQYAAAIVAVLVAILAATLWFDPVRSFYGVKVSPVVLRSQPNLTINRLLLAVVFLFFYDHAVRRLRRVELWMK